MTGALRRTRLRVPIRFKLAAVSAALTFAILLLFALIIGAFTQSKLRSSFDADLRASAADLQSQFQLVGLESQFDPTTGERRTVVNTELLRVVAAGGAAVRVFVADSPPIALEGTPNLGPLRDGINDYDDYRVVSRSLFSSQLGDRDGFDEIQPPLEGAPAAVQYGKPTDDLNATIARVRLFLALGVLIGTALAFLAGFVVARRAMRPIAGLTRAAREVARTRDPATQLPRPAANDEVAELATTLSDMLGQLDAARGETEQTLERQREFVADASHELRTPLTSILANLELLEDELCRPGGPRDADAASATAASALRSSRRMRRLVGDLLLLARADAGRRARREPVDLADVVREAAREAEPLGDDHPLTLDLPDAAGAATVDGVHDDLHRMVLNLLENAYLHTPPGTPVVASVRRRADGSVTLEVADRGPGVPAAQRERIFERFARTAGDRSTRGGSGLGLAIVRAVADAHGGRAEVGEAAGGGASFRVTLPAAPLRSDAAGVRWTDHGRADVPHDANGAAADRDSTTKGARDK